MSAFAVVILVVAVVAAAIGLLRLLGVVGGPRATHAGATWIDHPDETPVEERPSEDAPDPPFPHRPPAGLHHGS